jgi:hypothetical protein
MGATCTVNVGFLSLSQRLTARDTVGTRQRLLFGEDTSSLSIERPGHTCQLPQSALQRFEMQHPAARIGLVFFKAPWCPISLARIQQVAKKLPTSTFVVAAITLGTTPELAELKNDLPTRCRIVNDRNLEIVDNLGIYAGKGLLKPGIAVANANGAIEWLHIAEARSDDWQRLQRALTT